MSFPRGWLLRFLDEAFARSPTRPRSEAIRSPTRARRMVLAMATHRGLLYGAPQLGPDQLLARDVVELFPLVRFLAVIADHVDIAHHLVPDPEPRRAALASALAVAFGSDEDARLLLAGGVPAKAEKVLLGLERELVKRRYLTGNPILGLTLNHAFLAIDARAIVLSAVDALAGRPPQKEQVERVQRRLVRERLAVAAAIARLSEWREEIDAAIVQQAALWQVKSLGLAKDETARLIEVVKSPPDLSRLLTFVPVESRTRVLAHTALAACVDGRVSPEERGFLSSLAGTLGISDRQQHRIERRVWDFVRRRKEDFNPLAHAAGFAAAGPPLPVRLSRVLFENMDALWSEIRETGDLAVLLARRAAGQKLETDEQRRMREQLLDVVRAVPSLAVFALPGGFVLLPLLLKLLPFDLRPSSFRDDDFHTFARGKDDALSDEDLQKSEDAFAGDAPFWRR